MSATSNPELIAKKRDGQELTDDEIAAYVDSVVAGSMADSQIGAMLMAMYIQNLSVREITTLTRNMMNSGKTLTWPEEWAGQIVDKHSTGGVGDKTSLILAPALAAVGLKVPMISGRGLGHTGGTLDKLESIQGYSVSLTHKEMTQILSEVGCFIAGATHDITPADKITYRLRDVTATVSHIGLITASIVSKKAAENPDALVLDVKTGCGAFLEEESRALELAKCMVTCSKGLGIKTVALLTDMDSPIGNMVGNALEVVESIQCLQGNGPRDLLDLVLDLGAHLLRVGGFVASADEGRIKLQNTITDGSALSKFCAMLKAQGVSPDVADDICNSRTDIWARLTPSKSRTDFFCLNDGYVSRIDAKGIAVVVHKLGGGRNVPDEKVNWAVGVQLLVDIGDKVKKDQAWVRVHHDSPISDTITDLLKKAIVLRDDPVKPRGTRTQQLVE